VNIKTKIGAALALGGLYAGQAYAAIPTAVTDAIDDWAADGAALVGALTVAAAAVVLLAKLLKRFGLMP
jgi:hypothetical protein